MASKLSALLLDSMAAARYAIKTFPERLVVFTGAGISAESGITPFRNATDGPAVWDKHSPEMLSSIQGFNKDPALVWAWYKDKMHAARHAKPNAGHLAIARSSAPIITQNVDNLHEQAGSNKVLHMHGQGYLAKCTECDWHGTYDLLVDSVLPLCPSCGSIGRPDVVWFGEHLDKALTDEAFELVTDSICLVVGTSAQVEPMASFPKLADMIISVNPRTTDHFPGAIQLTGTSSEILPKLLA